MFGPSAALFCFACDIAALFRGVLQLCCAGVISPLSMALPLQYLLGYLSIIAFVLSYAAIKVATCLSDSILKYSGMSQQLLLRFSAAVGDNWNSKDFAPYLCPFSFVCVCLFSFLFLGGVGWGVKIFDFWHFLLLYECSMAFFRMATFSYA